MTFTPGRDSPPHKYTAWGVQIGSQPGESLLWELPSHTLTLASLCQHRGICFLMEGLPLILHACPPMSSSLWPWLMLDTHSLTPFPSTKPHTHVQFHLPGLSSLEKLLVALIKTPQAKGVFLLLVTVPNACREHSTSRSLPGCITQMEVSS